MKYFQNLKILFVALFFSLPTNINPNVKIYGIYPGYRGDRASTWVTRSMEVFIRENRNFNQDNLNKDVHPNLDICNAIYDSIRDLDKATLDPFFYSRPILSGSSAAVLIVDELNKKLYVANLGDTRIVFGLKPVLRRSWLRIETRQDIATVINYAKKNNAKADRLANFYDIQPSYFMPLIGSAFQPLKSHLASDPLEYHRIVRAGGFVEPFGSIFRIMGYLTPSRALANRKYKLPSKKDRAYRASNPEIVLTPGNSRHRALLGKYLPATDISFSNEQRYIFKYDKRIVADLTPCDPEIWTGKLNADYEFAILGDSSLWDVLGIEEAVDIVRCALMKNKDPRAALLKAMRRLISDLSHRPVTIQVIVLNEGLTMTSIPRYLMRRQYGFH